MTDWPPWHPPPPPTLPARHRRPGRALLAAVIAAGLLALAAGGAALVVPDTAVYEVTGDGTAHITWWVGGQLRGVTDPAALTPDPWSLTLPAGSEVRAQLNGEGTITCTANGVHISKTGRFPYVVCGG